MENEHVLSGLIKKRREIAGKIEGTHDALRALMIDLDNLDAAIRIFKPDIDLETVKPKPLPPRNQAFKGEVTRIVLDVLRKAETPINSHELTMHVMTERGLNTADKKLVRTLQKRVGACLKHHRNRGLIRSRGNIGRFLAWEIAR